jgi:hypothetical protein
VSSLQLIGSRIGGLNSALARRAKVAPIHGPQKPTKAERLGHEAEMMRARASEGQYRKRRGALPAEILAAYKSRSCWICGRDARCAHREPEVEAAVLGWPTRYGVPVRVR